MALLTLQQDSPSKPAEGICANIGMKDIGILYSEFGNLISDWPYFSGELEFPIPSTDPNIVTPMMQYLRGGNLWEGEQGQLRWNLVQFAIDKLTAQLKEES